MLSGSDENACAKVVAPCVFVSLLLTMLYPESGVPSHDDATKSSPPVSENVSATTDDGKFTANKMAAKQKIDEIDF